MDRDRPRLPANKNCYLARLMSISSDFLFYHKLQYLRLGIERDGDQQLQLFGAR